MSNTAHDIIMIECHDNEHTHATVDCYPNGGRRREDVVNILAEAVAD